MHQIKKLAMAQHGNWKAWWHESFMSFTCLFYMTTLSNIVWLSAGVPFKSAFLKVGLNGNVIFYWFHVFGCVLWAMWRCVAGDIHMPFISPAELSSTPAITLEWNHAVIEKYANGWKKVIGFVGGSSARIEINLLNVRSSSLGEVCKEIEDYGGSFFLHYRFL